MSWSDVGDAYGNYAAGRSPIAAAIYQGITGNSPTPQPGQNPATALANSVIARYRRSPDPSTTMMGPNPTPAELNQPIQQSQPQQAPMSDPSGNVQPNPAAQQQSQWNQPGQQSNSPLNLASLLNKKPTNGDATDVGDLGGDAGLADLALMAKGGIASQPMTAKIAESGPEVAGGRIVTSPSIVKLQKGEAVVPLTPRPGNKLQPDLLEGHITAMKPQGESFSRFQRYGQGRGLMK